MCLSVTTLTAVSLISTLELSYEQLYHSILFIFNSWILIKMLRSEVIASFATPQAPPIEVRSQSRYVMLEYGTGKPILKIVLIRARSYFIEASVSSIGRLLLV